MADFNFGGINSLLRQLPGSAQQITNAISRGFGSVPSATRQLPPGAASIRQGLPNATVPSPLSVRFNPAANLPYPPRTPLFEERLYNATRTGLTNARNAVGAAVDTGRGVANILGRAAGPSMEAVQGGLGSAGTRLTNMAGGANPLAAGAAGSLGRGLLGRAAVVGDIYVTGKQVFNPTDNILTSVQNLGTGIQNQFRSPQERQFYVGSDPVAVLGNRRISAQRGQANAPSSSAQGERPYGSTATLNGKPVVWAGKDYGWQSPITGSSTLNSLNSPGVQNRFIQDTGSSSSPAAERAYQAERSSVAQQAKQNPSLPISYQDQAVLARQALQGYDPASGPLPGAAQTAQDMGMAMWAKANPTLAAKIRPGQSGFGAIQNTLAGSVANTGFQLPTQLSFTPPPSVTPTPFPMEALQSGFQVPGAPTADQLSTYPEFNPNNVDIKLFSKFMQANPKK